MAEPNKILYLPFDEPEGSAVAYDYSASRADGAVSNATFVTGKAGNAIRFDGSGTCEVTQNVMSGRMNSDFTLTAWVKRIAVAPDLDVQLRRCRQLLVARNPGRT